MEYYETFSVKKELLKDCDSFVAIDAGGSLTKALCISKDDPLDQDHHTLLCATFTNANFDKAVDWLATTGRLTKNGTIPITGLFADKNKALIEEKTQLKVVNINEAQAQYKGICFLVENVPKNELFHTNPPADEKGTAFSGAFFKRMIKKMIMREVKKTAKVQAAAASSGDATVPSQAPPELTFEQMMAGFAAQREKLNKQTYPFLYAIAGTAFGVLKVVDATSSSQLVALSMVGGKTTAGLGQLLLGDLTYNEIMELAAAGNKSNVDYIASDVFSDDKNSPYSADPNLPLMPFGKMGDITDDMELSDFNKADIASSYVNMMASNTFSLISSVTKSHGTFKVYLGGNFYRSEIVRNAIHDVCKRFGLNFIEIYFLKTGHIAAIGALLSQKSA